MFDIYIKDYNDQNGNLVSEETLVQSIPSNKEELKLINPTVKCEMGNAESFTFSMESGTKYYDSFNQMKTFMRVVYDGWTIFFGRVLTIENSFYGNRRIRLEGPLAFLNDTSVEGQKEENRPSVDGKDYLIALLNNHNNMVDDLRRAFTIGELPGNYSSSVSDAQRIVTKERKYGTDGWTDTKSALEDLRSHYGGYFRIRCPGYQSADGKHWVVPNNIYGVQGYNFLDWMNHYFWKNEDSQEIEVGKNILDLTTSTEIDNIFTVVIPIGNNKSTSTSTVDGEKKSTGPQHFYVDGREVTVPSICAKYGQALNSGYHTYEDYEQALNKYGRIVKTVTFDDADNKEELLEKCQEWIKNNYQGEVTKFTVKAVDMHQIGDRSVTKITVGDRVRIIYPVFKENGTVEKRTISRTCLSINYDLYNPENNSYTFGIPANILTKSYGVTKQGKSTTDPSTKPRSSSSGGGGGEKSWLDKVREWLMNHKVNYKHTASNWRVNDPEVYPNHPDVYPYKDSYKNRHQKGPYGDRRDYFYSTEYVGGTGHFTIWKFTRAGDEAIPELNPYIISEIRQSAAKGLEGKSAEYIAQVQDEAVEEYKKSLNCTLWTGEIVTMTTPLSEAIIHQYNIIQYVKQEYGYDLTIMGNTQMPPYTYTDPETGTRKTVQATEGKVVTIDMFKEGTTLAEGYHLTVAPDGSQVISVEVNGQLRYYTPDPDHPGEVVEFDKFDIRSEVVNTADSWGFARQKWFYDEKTQTWGLKTFEFTNSIERYAGGPLVVAKVQGDVVELGGVDSSQVITGALKNISNVCGEFEYEVDPDTGERHVIVKEGSAILQTQDGAQMAYFHDGNLTGEIAINKINETGQTEAKISADQVRIEGKTFVQAGLVEETYIKLTPAEVSGKNPKDEGWYEYNKDTETYVLTEDTSPKTNKDYFRKDSRVTGELLIHHINNTGETEAKLSADQVRIQGRTFVQAGIVEGHYRKVDLSKYPDDVNPSEKGWYNINDKGEYFLTGDTSIVPDHVYFEVNPNEGMTTGELLIHHINDNETEAKLTADQVRIQGRTFVEAGIVSGHYRKVDLSRYPDDVNPQQQGWYNINDKGEYFLTGDTSIVSTHEYFEINPREGMVTGELLIQHINDNETEAKLTADQIRINGRTFFQAGLVEDDYLEVTLYGGEDPWAEGLYEYDKVNKKYVLTGDHSIYPGKHYYRKNPNGGMLTAGILVDKINDQNVTFIRGDRVVIGDTASEESVMSALMTSGAVTSSEIDTSAWPDNTNPQKEGWYYKKADGTFERTTDTHIVPGTKYFRAPHEGKSSQALVAKNVYTTGINSVNASISYIKNHYLESDWIQGKISKFSLVNVQAIASASGYPNAYCSLDSYYGNHYKFNVSGGGGVVTHKDLRYAIAYVTVTSSGPTSTIHLYSFMEGELTSKNTGYVPQDVWDNNKLTFKNYTGGWDAAYSKCSWPYTHSTSQTGITIYIPSNEVDKRISRTYYLGSADKNHGGLFTMVYDDKGVGTEVQVAQWTHSKYNEGWEEARKKCSWPYTHSTSQTGITIYVPDKDVGKNTSRTYYLGSVDKNHGGLFTMVYNAQGVGTEVQVAQWTHSKYNEGWEAAYDEIILPASEDTSHDSITVQVPTKEVDNGHATRTYILKTNGKNDVKLETAIIRNNQTVYIPVANLTHRKYNEGWKAAYDKIYLPIAEVTNKDSITIQVPPKEVDGQYVTRTYIMGDDGSNATKLTTAVVKNGQTTYVTVAKHDHYQYHYGWNAATKIFADGLKFHEDSDYFYIAYSDSSSTPGTYTYSENAFKLFNESGKINLWLCDYSGQTKIRQACGMAITYPNPTATTVSSSDGFRDYTDVYIGSGDNRKSIRLTLYKTTYSPTGGASIQCFELRTSSGSVCARKAI